MTWNQEIRKQRYQKPQTGRKNIKIMKNYIPVKYGNPPFSENYNPDWPETKKFGISIIENLILVDKILKIIFPINSLIRGIRKIIIRFDLKPRISESASSKTSFWLIKYKKIMKNYFPCKFGNPRNPVNYNPYWPETNKFGISVIENSYWSIKY